MSSSALPPLSLEEALRRLATQREIICLDGGPGAWTYLLAPEEGTPLGQLGDIDIPTVGSAELHANGWPAAISGGALLQLDYGCPVGPHAAAVAHAPICGRQVRMDAWLAWDGEGRVQLCGSSRGQQRLRELLQQAPADCRLARPRGPLRPAWSATEHHHKVEQVRAAIAAGVCFQANLAVPFHLPIEGAAHADIALFCALRQSSPAPYATFWRQPAGSVNGITYGARSICSHSPECFLQGDGTRLRSDPIKGTSARVAGEETARRAALFASAKDRAELAMIIDLVRNDLGRIAQTGSVRVDDPAAHLDLDYVHHLVGRISCRPQAGSNLRDWLAATYPAGSITGAPKIQVMGLLQELEGLARGPYCGTFGWLGQASCALAVAIRSMVVTTDQITFAAGGGIVADSDPISEWAEVTAKARRMAEAAGAG